MTAFKNGDRVRLVDSIAMNAPVGALATVTQNYDPQQPWLAVAWDKAGHTQVDGRYRSDRFELVAHRKQGTCSLMAFPHPDCGSPTWCPESEALEAMRKRVEAAEARVVELSTRIGRAYNALFWDKP